MVRVPLEELVLQIQLLRLGPTAAFLEQVIEPPPPRSIQAAVAQLQAIGALSPQEQLTPLGAHCPPQPHTSPRALSFLWWLRGLHSNESVDRGLCSAWLVGCFPRDFLPSPEAAVKSELGVIGGCSGHCGWIQ